MAISHPISPPTSRAFTRDILFCTSVTDNVSRISAVLAPYFSSCPITAHLARKDAQTAAVPGSAGIWGVVVACFATSPAKVSPVLVKLLD
jgi:hypothetical protein